MKRILAVTLALLCAGGLGFLTHLDALGDKEIGKILIDFESETHTRAYWVGDDAGRINVLRTRLGLCADRVGYKRGAKWPLEPIPKSTPQ